jgi:outer membrane protein OmpA-like peptidoglycan-associated protein
LISGYSDNLGAEQYNLSLSRRRAETVARYLADNGIQRTRLQVEGLGAIQVSANTGEQELLPGYNEWRIVEIRISLPGRP